MFSDYDKDITFFFIIAEQTFRGFVREKRLHFGDGNKKGTESENGNDISVDNNVMTTEIMTFFTRNIYLQKLILYSPTFSL